MTEDETLELLETFAMLQTEGRTPIVAVKGYAELLLEGHGGELSAVQRQMLAIIRRQSMVAMEVWKSANLCAKLRYRSEAYEWQLHPIELTEVIPPAVAYLKDARQIETIEVRLPAELPTVKADYYLEDALVDLLGSLWSNRPAFPPAVISAHRADAMTVRVRLRIEAQVESWPEASLANLFYHRRPNSMLALLLHRYGSELQFHAGTEEAAFEFDLAVWNEAQP